MNPSPGGRARRRMQASNREAALSESQEGGPLAVDEVLLRFPAGSNEVKNNLSESNRPPERTFAQQRSSERGIPGS